MSTFKTKAFYFHSGLKLTSKFVEQKEKRRDSQCHKFNFDENILPSSFELFKDEIKKGLGLINESDDRNIKIYYVDNEQILSTIHNVESMKNALKERRDIHDLNKDTPPFFFEVYVQNSVAGKVIFLYFILSWYFWCGVGIALSTELFFLT
jgi:hypothetical protein